MAMQCDICGGTLEIRSGEGAVCTQCGLTYSKERLLEKVKASAPAPAQKSEEPAPAASAANVDNQIRLARLHLRNERKSEAVSVCDKVLESDFYNSDAWEIKIAATDPQEKAASLFVSYYETVKTDKERARVIQFGKDFYQKEHTGDLYFAVEVANILFSTSPEIADAYMCRAMDQSTAEWKDWLKETREEQAKEKNNKPEDHLLGNFRSTMLIKSIRNRVDWNWQVREGLEKTLEYAKRSKNPIVTVKMGCFCEFVLGCLQYAKSYEAWRIDKTEQRYIGYFNGPKYETIVTFKWGKAFSETDFDDRVEDLRPMRDYWENFKKEQELRLQEKEKQRVAQYWAEHAEEKAKLESERAQLEKQMAQLVSPDAKYDSMNKKLLDLEKEIRQMQQQRDSMGIFKSKQKELIRLQIVEKEKEKAVLSKECQKMKDLRDHEKGILKARLQKINEQLTKAR